MAKLNLEYDNYDTVILNLFILNLIFGFKN